MKILKFTVEQKTLKLHRNYSGFEGAIQLNDGATFEEAFRSYYQPLRFYAIKFVSEDDAEDLVENLFLKLWNKKQQFESPAHLQAFLYHAIRNACLDNIKLSKKGKTDELSDALLIADDDHLRSMIHAESIAEIYRAVNGLPSQCSKVIRMGYLEGLNNAEIAEKLGLSEQTIKNYKVRGLGLLKQRLSDSSFVLFLLLFDN
ncbi:RNA polymerase sigma factor [Pedobacter frigoris]|uniref:RNA polymerase sigma factor n=1 Tax=Pedobacter frigoris TaxID=2571272 RepID=UPI002930CAE5|nr:sigma-70 family RNA polymerase sigma factor [Pedobacter frigoris]